MAIDGEDCHDIVGKSQGNKEDTEEDPHPIPDLGFQVRRFTNLCLGAP